MKRQVTMAALFAIALVGGNGWAQRAGGRMGGAPPPAPPARATAEEKARVENVKPWAADIEKVRAQSLYAPLPQIKFPSENEKLLGRLRFVEDPKLELARYLDKLWKDAKDETARRAAFEQFWLDAEKPKWARAATEDYFQKRANVALKAAQPSTSTTTTTTTTTSTTTTTTTSAR